MSAPTDPADPTPVAPAAPPGPPGPPASGKKSPGAPEVTPQAHTRRAAPLRKRLAAQGTYETKAVLRNGEQLLVTIALPVIALAALGGATIVSIPTDGASRLAVVVPGVFALAVLASSFTSQAIATAFDRRNGVLRQMATTPLGPSGLLIGKIIAVVVVQLIEIVLVALVALAMGWRPVVGGIPLAVLAWVLGAIAFTSLAFLVAGTLRAEAVLAVANLLLVGLAFCGVVLPVESLPAGLQQVATFLPSGALGEVLRDALAHGQVAWLPLVVLAVWAAGLAAAAARWFTWDS